MNTYTGIALAKKQVPFYFREFGSYQGEWILASYDNSNVYIYKGYYGSCLVCDDLQSDEPITPEEDAKFAEGYHPFLELPIQDFMGVVEKGILKEVLPKNVDYDTEIGVTEVADAISSTAKCLWGNPTVDDILAIRNAEVLRVCLDKYGIEKFLEESHAVEKHTEGDNVLYTIGDRHFLYLKDSSSDRRYLVEIEKADTVKQGIAWSFGMKEEDYNPLIET